MKQNPSISKDDFILSRIDSILHPLLQLIFTTTAPQSVERSTSSFFSALKSTSQPFPNPVHSFQMYQIQVQKATRAAATNKKDNHISSREQYHRFQLQ